MATQEMVTVFAALADETRLDIVHRLVLGESTLSELAEHYDMSLQAVSKHVLVLEHAGVVSRRRDAQRRPIHLKREVFDAMSLWIERYRQDIEASYQRLDQVLAITGKMDPKGDKGVKP